MFSWESSRIFRIALSEQLETAAFVVSIVFAKVWDYNLVVAYETVLLNLSNATTMWLPFCLIYEICLVYLSFFSPSHWHEHVFLPCSSQYFDECFSKEINPLENRPFHIWQFSQLAEKQLFSRYISADNSDFSYSVIMSSISLACTIVGCTTNEYNLEVWRDSIMFITWRYSTERFA